MRITKAQEAVLDGFLCQRLSSDPGNKKLVRNFECARNRGLAAYLRYRGWTEDTTGATTFYVIKDQQNKILLYFSLKCGSLFDPLNVDELMEQVERYKKTLEAIHNRRRGTAQDEELALVEQLVMDYGMSLGQLEWTLRNEMQDLKQKLVEAERDRYGDPNRMISQVVRTYPAVELVHFCINDDARDTWNKLKRKYKFTRSMGEVLFWRFVAPIIANVNNVLGCQYVYLFAADDSRNRSLVNYYQVALNFSQPGDIGTSKPRYDFTCEFMCQEIGELRSFRDYYFENFNPDPEDKFI